MYELAIAAIIVALIFDFINGFHDAANSIATVVGTRVLKPLHAVSLAATANFVGPFLFGVADANGLRKPLVLPLPSRKISILTMGNLSLSGLGRREN